MAVVYYQIFFMVSITVTFVVARVMRERRNPKWWVLPTLYSLACILWTLVQVEKLPLRIVQLLFIGATFVINLRGIRVAKQRRAQASRLAELEGLIAKLSQELSVREQGLLEAVPRQELRLLINQEEHKAAFYAAIAKAKETLCITSGWVNDRVVTPPLLGALRKALRRGVHVFIVFGYKSKHEEAVLKPDARRAVESLHKLAQEAARWNRGRLLIAHRPVHAKVVVCDLEAAIIGSNNWLSNSSFVNEERSVVVTDSAFATKMRMDVMEMARRADSNAIPRLLGLKVLASGM